VFLANEFYLVSAAKKLQKKVAGPRRRIKHIRSLDAFLKYGGELQSVFMNLYPISFCIKYCIVSLSFNIKALKIVP